MADLNALLIFAKVVDANSFSEAARRLQMPISTVSRRIAELEDQLGVRLLERSTRSLRLTVDRFGRPGARPAQRRAQRRGRHYRLGPACEHRRPAAPVGPTQPLRHAACPTGRRVPGILPQRPGADPHHRPLRRPDRRRCRSRVQAWRAEGLQSGRPQNPPLPAPACCKPHLPRRLSRACRTPGPAPSPPARVFPLAAGQQLALHPCQRQGQGNPHVHPLPVDERLHRPRRRIARRRGASASRRPS